MQETTTTAKSQKVLDKALNDKNIKRRMKRRNIVDSSWKAMFSIGGIGIISAVMLIMFFLIYVVVPIFFSAKVELKSEYPIPGNASSPTLFYSLDEYKATAIRVDKDGVINHFDLSTGAIFSTTPLNLFGQQIVSHTDVSDIDRIIAFGLSGGGAIIVEFDYKVSFPDGVRKIDVDISHPFGEQIINLAGGAIEKIAVRTTSLDVVFATKAKNESFIVVNKFAKTTSLFSDEISLEQAGNAQINYFGNLKAILLGGNARDLYLIKPSGETRYYDISNLNEIRLRQIVSLTDVSKGEKISYVRFLLGSFSLMVGTDQGRIIQWFPVRGDDNLFRLQNIREFDLRGSPEITKINIEHARRGFFTMDNENQLNIFHSTAQRHLASFDLDSKGVVFEVAPRANAVLIEQENGKVVVLSIDNSHPDVSVSSLWSKVWYEGYSEPRFVWQSSAAVADHEPKMSMVPLTFGTIKAAFYAMLFAIPIAVLAALYTAFFMDKKSRALIKPSIELIEAFPTVILGFLAGLWLAPLMEANLAGFFALFLIVPLGILLVGFLFYKLPDRISLLLPVGSRSLFMIPIVLFLGWLALSLDNTLEDMFFNGDMRHWLTFSAGIDFDQRNALVIGFAMGFMIIPTIFSVAEDAIYNVPTYLVNGSLALGASGWQTVVGVVLPTASPGVFSAIMLGFGRGVGETMIVLMASGNTPLMDVNIFEGMRTLAANLAVEMSETAVGSTHYRVLFLSGLLLFIFTFIFNTLAEIVRERMRKKYGSL